MRVTGGVESRGFRPGSRRTQGELNKQPNHGHEDQCPQQTRGNKVYGFAVLEIPFTVLATLHAEPGREHTVNHRHKAGSLFFVTHRLHTSNTIRSL